MHVRCQNWRVVNALVVALWLSWHGTRGGWLRSCGDFGACPYKEAKSCGHPAHDTIGLGLTGRPDPKLVRAMRRHRIPPHEVVGPGDTTPTL
jgi:hypothetical protein